MRSLSFTRPLALVATAALALAACGAKTDSAQVASLAADASAAASTTATTALSQADTQAAMLSYASCMRDHGVDMADPTFDANGNIQGGFGRGGGANVDFRSTEFQTAQDACSSLIQGITFGGGPGGGGFDRTTIQDAFNSFTKCLRTEGVQVDDITLGNGPGGGPGGGPPANGGATATTAGGATGTSTGGSDGTGGFRGAPGAGGPPPGAQGGPGAAGFNPADRIIEQLNLDANDPVVKAAVEKCQADLVAAFTAPNGSTTTTAKP